MDRRAKRNSASPKLAKFVDQSCFTICRNLFRAVKPRSTGNPVQWKLLDGAVG